MSKGLEALEYFRTEIVDNYYAVECFEIIEKELKALEIIKGKRVNVRALIKSYYSKYGFQMYNDTQCADKNEKLDSKDLTQEEYDLLKGMLNNE